MKDVNIVLTISGKALEAAACEKKSVVKTAEIALDMEKAPCDAAAELKTILDLSCATAVICPGGVFKPLRRGSYEITKEVLHDAMSGNWGDHPYNYLSLVCRELALLLSAQPIMQDPISSDELLSMNRVSSMSCVVQKSRYHACECAAMLSQAAALMELTRPDELNAICVYYDDAVSVAALMKGICLEVNDMIGGEGPMGFRASGDVPGVQLAKYRFSSGKSVEEIKEMLNSKSGVLAYLGTDCPGELDRMAESGDETAALIVQAMAYQTAKRVGMCMLALGKADVIIVGGKGARCQSYIRELKELVGAIAPVCVLPELDMRGYLAGAAMRAGTVNCLLVDY